MSKLLYGDLTFQIIGACIEVHNNLGCGFLEPVYQESLAIEMCSRKIPFDKEKIVEIHYKDTLLRKKYIADFVCYGNILLELKALSKITSDHEAQLLNYLKATGFEVGLLFNFGASKLEYKRMILTKNIRECL